MDDECMICLEPLYTDVAVLSCGHKYHFQCIQQWSKKIKTFTKLCSVCDTDVEIVNILNNNQNDNQKHVTDSKVKNNKIYPLDNTDSFQHNKNQKPTNQQKYSFCNIM